MYVSCIALVDTPDRPKAASARSLRPLYLITRQGDTVTGNVSLDKTATSPGRHFHRITDHLSC